MEGDEDGEGVGGDGEELKRMGDGSRRGTFFPELNYMRQGFLPSVCLMCGTSACAPLFSTRASREAQSATRDYVKVNETR